MNFDSGRIRTRAGCPPLLRKVNQVPSLACTTTPCPTAGWPPVTWKGSDAHVPYRSKPLEPLLALLPD
ncbi:unnamed protein product [Spirodela intermedia]|uniref:Uncharacterized protein n=1 Tax=Spirodela intermedia TaxID=51605 RepID=A0A7I8JUD5_SPIIN|nr:unnamed protein product [Spirodela intermedia]CAA6673817.1 unnamed protein product [Spirodela intermedia]